MSRLTWQQVTAPNFEGANEAFRLAAQQSNLGFTGLQSTLKDVIDRPRLEEEQRLATEKLRLANQGLDLGNQSAQAALENTQYNTQRTRAENYAKDQVNPLINEYFTQNAGVDSYEARNQFLANNADRFSNVPPSYVSSFLNDSGALVGTNRANTNAQLQRKANGILGQFQRDYTGSPALARQRYEEIIKGMNPDLVALIQPKMVQLFPNIFSKDLDVGPGPEWDTLQGTETANPNGQAAAAIDTNAGQGVSTVGLRGSEWADAVGLSASESGGKYDIQNTVKGSGGVGHFGKLQFSIDRLTDLKNAGIIPKDMTPEQFKTAGKEVQDAAADWHFDDIDRFAKKSGLDKYYGQTINGVFISPGAIRGMAHLGGKTGAAEFIKSNGKKDHADDFGTKISDYGKRFTDKAAPQAADPAAQLAADAAPQQPVPAQPTAAPQPTANEAANALAQSATQTGVPPRWGNQPSVLGSATPARVAAQPQPQQAPDSSPAQEESFFSPAGVARTMRNLGPLAMPLLGPLLTSEIRRQQDNTVAELEDAQYAQAANTVQTAPTPEAISQMSAAEVAERSATKLAENASLARKISGESVTPAMLFYDQHSDSTISADALAPKFLAENKKWDKPTYVSAIQKIIKIGKENNVSIRPEVADYLLRNTSQPETFWGTKSEGLSNFFGFNDELGDTGVALNKELLVSEIQSFKKGKPTKAGIAQAAIAKAAEGYKTAADNLINLKGQLEVAQRRANLGIGGDAEKQRVGLLMRRVNQASYLLSVAEQSINNRVAE